MNTFLTSDTHFSHIGIVKFLRADGSPERPWDNTEEMDEALVANWNSVVRPKDTVYHLGDVVINRSALPILARLNGIKILIKGNHDVMRLEEYAEYFKDIRGVGSLDGFVLSHIPLHPGSLERWKGCLHGHLHSNRVMRDVRVGNLIIPTVDPRYLSVCVEHTDYTPISLDEVNKRFKEQQE